MVGLLRSRETPSTSRRYRFFYQSLIVFLIYKCAHSRLLTTLKRRPTRPKHSRVPSFTSQTQNNCHKRIGQHCQKQKQNVNRSTTHGVRAARIRATHSPSLPKVVHTQMQQHVRTPPPPTPLPRHARLTSFCRDFQGAEARPFKLIVARARLSQPRAQHNHRKKIKKMEG